MTSSRAFRERRAGDVESLSVAVLNVLVLLNDSGIRPDNSDLRDPADSYTRSMDLPPSIWQRVNDLAGNSAWPPAQPEAIDEFLAKAHSERLIHLAHAANFDGELGQALASRRGETVLARGGIVVLHETLRRFAEIIDPVPVIPLKGIAYGLYLYDEPIHRPTVDVDVLIPIEHYDEANARVEAAGYRRLYPFGITGHHPDYPESNFRVGKTLLEIHHSLTQRSRHTMPYDEIFRRSEDLEGPPNLRRMADTHALLAHCVGFAKEHFNMSLSHWLDLWLLLHRPGVTARPPGEIIETAGEWSVLNCFLSALRALPRIISEAASNPLVQAAQSHPVPAIEPAEVLRARNRPGRFTQISMKFRALDGWSRRTAFLFQFTRMQIESRLGLVPKRRPGPG